MTTPNKVIDQIFKRFEKLADEWLVTSKNSDEWLVTSRNKEDIRHFLAESLMEVLTKEVNNYETPFETRMAMLSVLGEAR